MHRSHSRHTNPAEKMCPPSELRDFWDDEKRTSPGAAKQIKKFHNRKSRQYLKNRLRKDEE